MLFGSFAKGLLCRILAGEDGALRAFLDSFYHFCGYTTGRWHEWVKQEESEAGFNPRFKPRGKCVESSHCRQKLEEFGIDETA
jgi:hypothetical protein